jgi:hypothetical protein
MERMHAHDAMHGFLVDAKGTDQAYPPPVIYLAILKAERGERDTACALLQSLGATTSETWKTRISQVAARLSC